MVCIEQERTCVFFPKCLFPDLIVWYFLMGARFLFNTFLMHVSHQDKMIAVLLISQNQSTSLARCAFELEVHRYMRLNCLRKVKKRKEK